MNIEAYNYTVVTTVLGMLVVFLSLTALSLLMVALKASFGEQAARTVRSAGAAGDSKKTAAKAGPAAAAEDFKRPAEKRLERKSQDAEEERQPPPWLAAAVAAYLFGEERAGPSADPWLPEFNHYDPWLTPGRSTKSHSVRTRG
jgi:hypothetical protein